MNKMFTNFAVLVFFGLTISMPFYGREVEKKISPDTKGVTSSLTSGDQIMRKRPTFLYKVLSVEDWAKSQKTVHLAAMDAEFIHFATEDQLPGIIAKYWADVPHYVVLKVETSKLSGDLVFEANPGGTNRYYHLYNGSIPLSSIVEVKKT